MTRVNALEFNNWIPAFGEDDELGCYPRQRRELNMSSGVSRTPSAGEDDGVGGNGELRGQKRVETPKATEK